MLRALTRRHSCSHSSSGINVVKCVERPQTRTTFCNSIEERQGLKQGGTQNKEGEITQPPSKDLTSSRMGALSVSNQGTRVFCILKRLRIDRRAGTRVGDEQLVGAAIRWSEISRRSSDVRAAKASRSAACVVATLHEHRGRRWV